MGIREIAKNLLVFIGVFVVGFILHTSVLANFPLGVVTPNVMLLITSAFGFMRGGNYGMIMGFFAGLIMDCYYPEYFGLNCLIYLFIGYLNGLFAKLFYGDDIRLPLLLVGMSDILYGIVVYLFLFMARSRFDFLFYLLNIIIPEAVYTLVIFLILYFPLLKILRWVSGESNGRGRTIV